MVKKEWFNRKNVSSGWDKNGSKLYIDTPDYYINSWDYNKKLSIINNNFKEKINKKYEDDNISFAKSYLKENEEYNNKKINNILNKIDSDVMPVVAEHQLEQQRSRQKKEYDDMLYAHRIAQDAIREREIKEGREVYQSLKREENRAYRENESTIKHQSDKKLSRDDDNDFSMWFCDAVLLCKEYLNNKIQLVSECLRATQWKVAHSPLWKTAFCFCFSKSMSEANT